MFLQQTLDEMREDSYYGYPVVQRLTEAIPQHTGYERMQLETLRRELTEEPTEACWTCKGEQEVVEYGHGTGFAGGNIYWTALACGHTNMDESDDLRAAQ